MLAHLRRLRRRATAGSVTVEFAIISLFILGPLLAASADFIVIIAAKAQLNTALQALYYFAETNTALATNSSEANTIITTINNGSIYALSMPATLTSGAANPSVSYSCYTTGAAAPTFSTPSTSACASTLSALTLANYKITASVTLPFPVPGLASPMSLAVEGAVPTKYK